MSNFKARIDDAIEDALAMIDSHVETFDQKDRFLVWCRITNALFASCYKPTMKFVHEKESELSEIYSPRYTIPDRIIHKTGDENESKQNG